MRSKSSLFCGWFRQAACCNGVEPTAFFAFNDALAREIVSSKASLSSAHVAMCIAASPWMSRVFKFFCKLLNAYKF